MEMLRNSFNTPEFDTNDEDSYSSTYKRLLVTSFSKGEFLETISNLSMDLDRKANIR